MTRSEVLMEPRTQPAVASTETKAFMTIATGHAPRVESLPQSMSQRCHIFIHALQIDARIGVFDWEKAELQPLQIDLEFGLVSHLANHTDRLGDTIDYAMVVARLKELACARHYELVEAMGEAMAMVLQNEFGVPWLTLRLSKLAPFPGASVGIVIERGQRA